MNNREINLLYRAATVVEKLQQEAEKSPDAQVKVGGTSYSTHFLQQLGSDLVQLADNGTWAETRSPEPGDGNSGASPSA